MREARAKIIVVTGASSGIGRELALLLAAPDCEIWLVGRNKSRLAEIAEMVTTKGATPVIVETDLADINAAADFLKEKFPLGKKVDEVYLSAAITLFGEVHDTLTEDWDLIYRTNLLSPVQWANHFYSGMVKEGKGTIVIVSSLAAYAGYPTATAYATMKAGLLGLFRSLWYEGRAKGVSIHLASPGYVDTGIYRSAIFRNTTYENVMKLIDSLGFRSIAADQGAARIIRSVKKGEKEFAFPCYAAALKWCSPRMPFIIDMIHKKMVTGFRRMS